MKRIIFIVIAFMLSGCAVYKYTPKLDEKLSVSGSLLAKNSELAVEEKADENSKFFLSRLREQVKNDFSESGKYKVIITELNRKYPWGGKGFQCFEPYPLIISLGIIPSICEQEYQIKIRIQNLENKKLIDKVLTYKTNSVAGWLSLFYAASTDWNYKPIDEYKHAFFTLINGAAGEI